MGCAQVGVYKNYEGHNACIFRAETSQLEIYMYMYIYIYIYTSISFLELLYILGVKDSYWHNRGSSTHALLSLIVHSCD